MDEIIKKMFEKPLTKINFPKHEEKKLSLYTHEIHGKSEKQFSEHMKKKERSIKQMVRSQVQKPCPKKEILKIDDQEFPKRKPNPIPEKIVKIDNDLPRRTVVKPHKWPTKTNDKQHGLNHSQISILDQQTTDQKNALLEGIFKDMKVTEVPGCRTTNNNKKEALGSMQNLNQRSNPQNSSTKIEKNLEKKIVNTPCLEKANNNVHQPDHETSHKEKPNKEVHNTSHHKVLENKVFNIKKTFNETKKPVTGDTRKQINSSFEPEFEPKVHTAKKEELRKNVSNTKTPSTANADTEKQNNSSFEPKKDVQNKSTENLISSNNYSKIPAETKLNLSSPTDEAGSRLRRSKRRLNHQVLCILYYCMIKNKITRSFIFLLIDV